jgi:hypothetical protein
VDDQTAQQKGGIDMKTVVRVTLVFLVVVYAAVAIAGGKDTGSKVIYSATFTNKRLSDWTHIIGQNPYAEYGTWSVQNGVLQFTQDPVYRQAGCLRLDAITLPESYILEFDVVSIEIDLAAFSHTAFYTHFLDWSHWIGHGYRTGRIYINSENCGVDMYDYNLSEEETDSTQWHHIKYTKNGMEHTLYFDDRLIYKVYGTQQVSGGNLVLWANPGVHQFDNIRIRSLPKP